VTARDVSEFVGSVQFNEDRHEYTVAGLIVPSVTQVLGDLTIMKRLDPALLKVARERGRRVHKACDLFDRGVLDEASLDEIDEPYVRAWKRFKQDHEFEWELGERPMSSEKWGYAGTPDAIGNWRQKRRRPRVLVERKTGAFDPVHGPQTAAYLQLLHEEDLVDRIDYVDRVAVYLQPNGFYQIERLQDEGDWSHFVAALTVHRFKDRHGLL